MIPWLNFIAAALHFLHALLLFVLSPKFGVSGQRRFAVDPSAIYALLQPVKSYIF